MLPSLEGTKFALQNRRNEQEDRLIKIIFHQRPSSTPTSFCISAKQKMTTSNNPVGMPTSTIVLRDFTTVNRTRSSNRGAIHMLATAFLSGAVFYRLGSFGGCSSLWLNSNKSYMNSISSDLNSPEYYTSLQSSDPYVQTSESRTIVDPKNDRRFIPRTSLPYDCGKSNRELQD